MNVSNGSAGKLVDKYRQVPSSTSSLTRRRTNSSKQREKEKEKKKKKKKKYVSKKSYWMWKRSWVNKMYISPPESVGRKPYI